MVISPCGLVILVTVHCAHSSWIAGSSVYWIPLLMIMAFPPCALLDEWLARIISYPLMLKWISDSKSCVICENIFFIILSIIPFMMEKIALIACFLNVVLGGWSGVVRTTTFHNSGIQGSNSGGCVQTLSIWSTEIRRWTLVGALWWRPTSKSSLPRCWCSLVRDIQKRYPVVLWISCGI